MKCKIVATKNLNPKPLLDKAKVESGLKEIQKNAQKIMRQSGQSIAFSHYEYPPSDTMINSFLTACEHLNSHITKNWESSQELKEDLLQLYTSIIAYKKEFFTWECYLLNIVGATLGKLLNHIFINKLFNLLHQNLSHSDTLDLATKTFYRILKHQAHIDGNTRFAISIANLILLRNNLDPFILNNNNAVNYYKLVNDIRYGLFACNYHERIKRLLSGNSIFE